jgi:hypothetical protein
MASSTDAGDFKQASPASLPADVTTTTPVAIAVTTALLIALLFLPPSDMSEERHILLVWILLWRTNFAHQKKNVLATIGVFLFADFILAT